MKREAKFFFALAILGLVMLTLVSVIPVSAASFDADYIVLRDVVTPNQEALVEVTIKNNGPATTFEIFSLQNKFMMLNTLINLPMSGQETVLLKLFPTIKEPGVYGVTIYVKSTSETESKNIQITLVKLEDALKIVAVPDHVDKETTNIALTVTPQERLSIDELVMIIDSDFFKNSYILDVKPFETDTFNIPLNPLGIDGGVHTLNIALYENGVLSATKNLDIVVEKIDNVVEEKSITGLFIKDTRINLVNRGNVRKDFEYNIQDSFFTNLFTTYNPDAKFVRYKDDTSATWDVNLGPQETYSVVVRTNYLYPLFLLLIVLGVTGFYVNQKQKTLIVSKNVAKAKSSNGLALKVTLHLRNNKNAILQNVVLEDYLPHITKLYEKFEHIHPSKIKHGSVVFEVGDMTPNEHRIVSYFIYSHVSVLGSLDLSKAVARFSSPKGYEEAFSNRVSVLM